MGNSGGHIEEGESKEDAARRECMEETGCTVKELTFLCMQNPANGMSDCICHVFAARVDTESVDYDEDEAKTKRWVSRGRVLEMLKNNETKGGFYPGIVFCF